MKNFLKFKTRQNSTEQRKFGEEHYLKEAKLWRPFRLFGVFAHLSAMIFFLSALVSSDWMHGKGKCSILSVLSSSSLFRNLVFLINNVRLALYLICPTTSSSCIAFSHKHPLPGIQGKALIENEGFWNSQSCDRNFSRVANQCINLIFKMSC